MKTVILRWKFVLIMALLGGSQIQSWAGPPVNDNFSSAIALSGLPVTATGSNAEATRQPGEPNSPLGYDKASVWWQWTAPVSGWVEMNTLGSTFDTGLAVFTGSGVETLSIIEFNDGTLDSDQSRLRFQATTGTQYRIQVQGWFGASGNIQLEIKPAQAPQPPVLQSFTLIPAASYFAPSYLDLGFLAPEGLRRVTIIMTGPRGDVIRYPWQFDELALLNGDRYGGSLRVPINGDAGLLTTDGGPSRNFGNWSISLILTDLMDAAPHFGGTGSLPLPAGSNPVLNLVSNKPLDLLPPTIIAASATPQTVDVTNSDQVIQIELIAADDVELNDPEFGQVFMFLSSDTMLGPTLFLFSWDSHVGTSTLRTSRGTITIPRNSPSGTYGLVYQVYDKTGMAANVSPGSPSVPAGIQRTVTVLNSNRTDQIAPTMVSVTADTSSVDALPGNKVTFTVSAADNVGVEGITVSLTAANSNNNKNVGLHLSSGTPQSGEWTGSITFDEQTVPGTYSLRVLVYDAEKNLSRYSKDLKEWPVGSLGSITIKPGPSDAYSVWRSKFPALVGDSGEPTADADADGVMNVLEFMCGTHPLLPSGAKGSDPLGSRAPVFTFTPTHLRVEYCLSRENYRMGTGSYWGLELASGGDLNGVKRFQVGTLVTKDLYRIQLPLGAGPSLFAYLKVAYNNFRFSP